MAPLTLDISARMVSLGTNLGVESLYTADTWKHKSYQNVQR